jgi:hypothetical protein
VAVTRSIEAIPRNQPDRGADEHCTGQQQRAWQRYHAYDITAEAPR